MGFQHNWAYIHRRNQYGEVKKLVRGYNTCTSATSYTVLPYVISSSKSYQIYRRNPTVHPNKTLLHSILTLPIFLCNSHVSNHVHTNTAAQHISELEGTQYDFTYANRLHILFHEKATKHSWADAIKVFHIITVLLSYRLLQVGILNDQLA